MLYNNEKNIDVQMQQRYGAFLRVETNHTKYRK